MVQSTSDPNLAFTNNEAAPKTTPDQTRPPALRRIEWNGVTGRREVIVSRWFTGAPGDRVEKRTERLLGEVCEPFS